MTSSRRTEPGTRVAAATAPEMGVHKVDLDPAINATIRARVLERVGHAVSELSSRPMYETAKRLLDLAVALPAAIVLLPFMAFVALMIKLDSRGPVFFYQERLGKGLRPFHMIKFRSMRIDADELPVDLIKQNESTGPLFKMRSDPRITRVGRILRRTSLDELPQLFNVLTGKMTLVGPRPPLTRELDGYQGIQSLRLRVRPGLTGLWQISGRSDLTFEDMVRLDLLYIERRGMRYDLKIILKTVPSVLKGHGAY